MGKSRPPYEAPYAALAADKGRSAPPEVGPQTDCSHSTRPELWLPLYAKLGFLTNIGFNATELG